VQTIFMHYYNIIPPSAGVSQDEYEFKKESAKIFSTRDHEIERPKTNAGRTQHPGDTLVLYIFNFFEHTTIK